MIKNGVYFIVIALCGCRVILDFDLCKLDVTTGTQSGAK